MMKKLLLVLILIPFLHAAQAQEEIVKWTFPNNSLADTVQNSTNPLNAGQVIRVEGAGPVSMKNGATDFAMQAINWNDGMNVKNWNIRFVTTGYDHVRLSSKQQGGGTNGGPKEFKLQYKVGSTGAWADLPGGNITLANDWTTGVISDLDLPAECQNQSNLVYIRWIMASNNDIKGGSVTAAGISKIDDIIVTGMPVTSLDNERTTSRLSTFPNPSTASFSVSLPTEASVLEIYNTHGQLVYKAMPENKIVTINEALPAGLYFVKAIVNGKVSIEKHIVK
jgi:large repetitive protein